MSEEDEIILDEMFLEEEICNKLKLIENLKEGETISTVNEAIIKRDCLYRTFQRFRYGEDRWKALQWITKVIREAIDYIISSLNSIDKLKNHLGNCQTGLENLKKTYQDDPQLQEKIKELQETIEQRLTPHNQSRVFYSTALHALDIPYKKYQSKWHQFLSQSYPNTDVHFPLKKMEDID